MKTRIHLDQGPAQMVHDPSVLETKASKRARERFFFPKPPKERPHLWLPAGSFLSSPSWMYSNDGTHWQHKALVYEVKGKTGPIYYAVIRRNGHNTAGWDLDEIKAWAEMMVQQLILADYNFYGAVSL